MELVAHTMEAMWLSSKELFLSVVALMDMFLQQCCLCLAFSPHHSLPLFLLGLMMRIHVVPLFVIFTLPFGSLSCFPLLSVRAFKCSFGLVSALLGNDHFRFFVIILTSCPTCTSRFQMEVA